MQPESQVCLNNFHYGRWNCLTHCSNVWHRFIQKSPVSGRQCSIWHVFRGNVLMYLSHQLQWRTYPSCQSDPVQWIGLVTDTSCVTRSDAPPYRVDCSNSEQSHSISRWVYFVRGTNARLFWSYGLLTKNSPFRHRVDDGHGRLRYSSCIDFRYLVRRMFIH